MVTFLMKLVISFQHSSDRTQVGLSRLARGSLRDQPYYVIIVRGRVPFK